MEFGGPRKEKGVALRSWAEGSPGTEGRKFEIVCCGEEILVRCTPLAKNRAECGVIEFALIVGMEGETEGVDMRVARARKMYTNSRGGWPSHSGRGNVSHPTC